ncbi:MAG: adenylate/guanylate cyclase domain-containing protein [Chlamydiota bacterium]
MKMKFKKDRFLVLFFVFLGATLLVLLSCLLLLFRYQVEETENFKRSYESYVIAGEMRQSSDDLTKMVRLYVLTGDKKYVDAYNEILTIRNGVSLRPLDYDLVYWDFVLDPNKRPRPYGPAISLQQLMTLQGFSQKEFSLLKESQLRSNTLVEMEREAIHAMQGLYNNGSGDYLIKGAPNPELARRLVSNQEYMEQKAKIMEPLLTFSQEVEQRTEGREKKLEHLYFRAILWAIFFTLFATTLMIVCLLKSMRSLAEAFKTNEDLLLNMLPATIAERFKQGEETIVGEYQASVLFLHLSHFGGVFAADEISEVFDGLNALTEKFGVEKIQVVGDSQVVVAGIPVTVKDHEVLLADFALALKKWIKAFDKSAGLDLHLRIGMTSGTVIAGVVGHKKFVYDLWGDVVTLASALEVTGVFGEIQISETMARTLDNLFEVEERGIVELPGLSSMKTYFLKKRRIEKKSFL